MCFTEDDTKLNPILPANGLLPFLHSLPWQIFDLFPEFTWKDPVCGLLWNYEQYTKLVPT